MMREREVTAMIKGCQREMIVMQTQDSKLFESAYFILRRQRVQSGKTDMLAEANRIIGAGSHYFERKRRKRPGLWLFLCGALCGSGVLALVLAIFGVY